MLLNADNKISYLKVDRIFGGNSCFQDFCFNIDVGPRTGFFLMKLREDDHDHHSEINWYYYYPLIQGILFVAFASRSCTELVRVKGTCNHNVSRSSVICKLLAGYAAFIKKFPPIASLRKATNYNTVHPAMRGEIQARPDGVHQTC